MEILSCQPQHPIPDGQVTLLGAVDVVVGAMTRVDLGSSSLLIDCGAPLHARVELPSQALDVDAVLLTHGHADHVSALFELLVAGFRGPIVATQPTLTITRTSVRDGIRLNGGSDRDTRFFIERFEAQTHAVPYGVSRAFVEGLDAHITFHEAGHILGSASIEIETSSQRLLFSGDLGRPNSPLLRDYNLEYRAGRPFDFVLMESTYGGREHAHDFDSIERQLLRIVERARRDSGHILVPAFAIGRTQTLLYLLNSLVETGQIRDLPVAIDSPLALKVTELYQDHRPLFDRESLARIASGDDPLEFTDLYSVLRARDSRRLREVDEILVIAGSGMCTGGRILDHLKALLPVPETCLLFVGYQARGTLGRDIQRASRRDDEGWVRIEGENVPVRAQIETLSGLSAHADRGELGRWLDAIPSPGRVALHHGEPKAQKAFVRWYAESRMNS